MIFLTKESDMTAARSKTAETDEPVLELVDTPEPKARRLPRLTMPTWLAGDSPAVVWIGIGLAAIGFVLIGYAWSQVAAETQVYLQLPYLVSAGLTGLGLIIVGVTVINVTAKRRDAAERERQMDQLVSILGRGQDGTGRAAGATAMSPYRRSSALLTVLAVAGLAGVLLAWRSVADSLAVSIQLPVPGVGCLRRSRRSRLRRSA